ncbi:DNL zinc finger containing protein, putative [Leishmania lindenbergi]|uniref:DNL zinc finger containing protein n=1 Tax=Leishmania lindenbergi TaxID=651832 RepID=A0AAW3ACB6_9TRYP
MLNRPTLLSVSRLLAVPRGSHVGTRIVSALDQRLQPALRTRTCCASFSVSSLVAASRRWCSTGSLSSNASNPRHSQAKTPSTDPSAVASTSLAAHHDVTASATSVEEQLKMLSPEDQEHIIAALNAPENEKSSVMGGTGIGPANGDMVAAFTCGPCDYRMVKRFSKHAYTKGIVIVECPNCRSKHLLADNLGWMEDTATNIEDILKAKGESFVRIGETEGDYQVVADPAVGASSP